MVRRPKKGNNGTVKVGTVSASLTGTGAAYGTPPAATKVAFMGWLKNPSA